MPQTGAALALARMYTASCLPPPAVVGGGLNILDPPGQGRKAQVLFGLHDNRRFSVLTLIYWLRLLWDRQDARLKAEDVPCGHLELSVKPEFINPPVMN